MLYYALLLVYFFMFTTNAALTADELAKRLTALITSTNDLQQSSGQFSNAELVTDKARYANEYEDKLFTKWPAPGIVVDLVGTGDLSDGPYGDRFGMTYISGAAANTASVVLQILNDFIAKPPSKLDLITMDLTSDLAGDFEKQRDVLALVLFEELSTMLISIIKEQSGKDSVQSAYGVPPPKFEQAIGLYNKTLLSMH